MKKAILIFVLAAFAMIAVGKKPLFKKSSNIVTSKCIKGKIYTTYEYFDYYFYSGKTVIKSIKFKKADLNDYFNPEEADWNATELYDEDIEYTIVGSSEADSLNNKISNESPLGAALIGKKVGDTVKIEAPVGEIEYKIISVDND